MTPSSHVAPSPAGSWLRRLGVVVVTCTLVASTWWAPFSPMAMERAHTLYGMGDVSEAAHHLSRVGRWHPLASVRVAANLEAATIATADLKDPETARLHLRRVLGNGAADLRTQTHAWTRLGDLERHAFDAPEAAAVAYETAWRLDPNAPEADERLVAAARARAEAGDVEAAITAWSRVAKHLPGEQARALVNQGSLHLAAGDEFGALEAYEAAIEVADDDTVRQVARLGAAACKERMGRIDDALSDIADADLPDDVAAERLRRLEERAEQL